MTAQAVKRGSPLQELLQAASKRQIAAAAFACHIPAHRLARYAIGATSLDAEESQALGDFLLRGNYYIKGGARDAGRPTMRLSGAKARAGRRHAAPG